MQVKRRGYVITRGYVVIEIITLTIPRLVPYDSALFGGL